MNTLVLSAIVVILVAFQWVVTRWLKLNRLAWITIWWSALFVGLSYGVNPPLPSSIIVLFMAIVTLALATYLSADADELAAAKHAIVSFLVERKVPLVTAYGGARAAPVCCAGRSTLT